MVLGMINDLKECKISKVRKPPIQTTDTQQNSKKTRKHVHLFVKCRKFVTLCPVHLKIDQLPLYESI